MAHVPRASNMLSMLASTSDTISSEPQDSVAFHARPPKNTVRDPETLRIIEHLELGPYEHKPHQEDPGFENLEPHSGLRLQYVEQVLMVCRLTDHQVTLYAAQGSFTLYEWQILYLSIDSLLYCHPLAK